MGMRLDAVMDTSEVVVELQIKRMELQKWVQV